MQLRFTTSMTIASRSSEGALAWRSSHAGPDSTVIALPTAAHFA
jgi:hypothetical protein